MRNSFVSGIAVLSTSIMFSAAASAVVIEDFESYAVDTYPGAWTETQNTQSTSPRVRNNGNNISGNHLEFSAPYTGDVNDGAETIARLLPVSINDGDWIQVAAQIPTSADAVGAWLIFGGGTLFSGGFPAAAIGLESQQGQFNHAGYTVFGDGDFGSASKDTWYYLRATFHDANANTLLDSYDFQIFSDAAGTNLIDQKLGIAFVGGEGFIGSIALRIFPQSGNPVGVALFDEITTNVPEPASAMTAATGCMLYLARRRRMAKHV